MNIKNKLASALLATLMLAACGGGMSGTYGDAGANFTITFSGSTVDLDMGLAGTHEMKYSVDGNKIVLKTPQGNLVLTRNADGSISTPWGRMKKKN